MTDLTIDPKNLRGADLADYLHTFLVKNPDKHNQTEWGSECGTTACIAGWAGIITNNAKYEWEHYQDDDYSEEWLELKVTHPDFHMDFDGLGAHLLGLSWSDANRLFHTFDKEQALAALKQVADTGKIDWDLLPKVEYDLDYE